MRSNRLNNGGKVLVKCEGRDNMEDFEKKMTC